MGETYIYSKIENHLLRYHFQLKTKNVLGGESVTGGYQGKHHR